MTQAALTDDDVSVLYRALLGRAPESADTVAAFRGYYADMVAGRRAILASDEFRTLYTGMFGGDLGRGGDALGALAREVLARAACAPPAYGVPAAAGELRDGLRDMFARHGAIKFGVILGDSAPHTIADLAPFGDDAAVLVVGPPPPGGPIGKIPDGPALFYLDFGATALAAFLRGQRLRIDALYVFAPNLIDPADEALARACLPYLADRALVILGPNAGALHPIVAGARADAPSFAWQDMVIFSLGFWCLPVAYAEPACISPADPRHAPSLAVATIMRNEEAAIGNMLRSVLPVMRYCVLVDTGSTDATVPIARHILEDAGIDHCIIEIPPGRFDDMRNAALDLVPDWIAWVLMLDADEEIVTDDHASLLTLLRCDAARAYALPRYNFIGPAKQEQTVPYPDRQVRLLRNGGAKPPRYSGAVHETVRGVDLHFPALDASVAGGARGGPHIHHLVRRFRTPAQEDAKQGFYRDLAASDR